MFPSTEIPSKAIICLILCPLKLAFLLLDNFPATIKRPLKTSLLEVEPTMGLSFHFPLMYRAFPFSKLSLEK